MLTEIHRCPESGMFSFFQNKSEKRQRIETSEEREILDSAQNSGEDQILKFYSLSEHAVIPNKRHTGDAGYDLYSIINIKLQKGERHLFNTNIRVELPPGYCGLIKGRSGLAIHHGILVHPGVIDSGYLGDLGVILFNLGQQEYTIKRGDRIAQLVVVKHWQDKNEGSSCRGTEGFGSSGQ